MLIMKLTAPLEVEVVCSVEGCDDKAVGGANFNINMKGFPILRTLGEGLRVAGWRLVRHHTGILSDPKKPIETPYTGYRCICPTHGKEELMNLQWKTER